MIWEIAIRINNLAKQRMDLWMESTWISVLAMSLKRNLEQPQSSQNNVPATKSSRKNIHLNFDTLLHVFKYLGEQKWFANAAQVC